MLADFSKSLTDLPAGSNLPTVTLFASRVRHDHSEALLGGRGLAFVIGNDARRRFKVKDRISPERAPAVLPTLTVAISTRGVRALGLRASDWPEIPGVDYLVLVQDIEADPAIEPHLARLASRPSVTVLSISSTGLSRSRNAALDNARGDILLITDDDVSHPAGAYSGLRRFFAEHAETSIVCGISCDPDGNPRKKRRNTVRRMSRFNSGGISSHELAFRLAPVRSSGVRFDVDFGAGAGTTAFLGEEYIFVADCLRAGLVGNFVPQEVSIHPAESSGFVWKGTAAARARAATINRVFGPVAPFARFAFWFKNRRRFECASDAWAFLYS